MDEQEWLADRFEEHRAHLGAVAYRMLGSVTKAEIRGPAAVAGQALGGGSGGASIRQTALLRPALVNGAAGVAISVRGRPFAVMGFTVAEGKIVEIDVIADPQRVRRVAAAVLTEE